MPTPIEDEFIPWGREAQQLPHGSRGHLAFTGCAGARARAFERVCLVNGNWVITPRGADLLATADAIGYDPTAKPEPAPKPATRECPGCKGEGRVQVSRSRDRTISELVHGEPADLFVLPGWDMTCGTCKGACVVPALKVSFVFHADIDTLERVDAALKRVAEATGIPYHENVAPADVERRRRELVSRGWTIVEDKFEANLMLTRSHYSGGLYAHEFYHARGHRLTYRKASK